MMNQVLAWCRRMMSESDGTPSAKRFIFVFGSGVAGGIVAALAAFIIDKCTGAQVIGIFPVVFGSFISATVVGYVGGKAAERGQNVDKPNP